jgi:hypothetical protein
MRLSWWSLRDRIAVIIGLVLPCGVAAALAPFRSGFANTDAALVLVAVVVLVAANGHRIAGVLAAVSAAVWFDFFLTAPYQRLTITDRTDVETTVLLVAVGVAVTELAVRGRRQRVLAQTDASYLAAIASTAGVIGAGSSPAAVADHVSAQLTALLGLRGCRFESGRYGGMPRLEDDGQIRASDSDWDLDQFGMPDTDVELLCRSDGLAVGRFVLRPTPGVTPRCWRGGSAACWPHRSRRLTAVTCGRPSRSRLESVTHSGLSDEMSWPVGFGLQFAA